eukprot:evm.model.scf_1388EXC.5 EVM.evm.TU.scf_1388EXC.5   scf_1388EXC:33160-40998(-)
MALAGWWGPGCRFSTPDPVQLLPPGPAGIFQRPGSRQPQAVAEPSFGTHRPPRASHGTRRADLQLATLKPGSSGFHFWAGLESGAPAGGARRRRGADRRCCGAAAAMQKDFRLPYWFQFVSILGDGAHGLVVEATDLRIKDPARNTVAIKLIPRGEATINKYVDREVLALRGLWHKHIVGFREACLSATHLCIVLNHVGGGTLQQFVHRNRCLPEALARWLFQQLITAVDYCHKQGITNRDIKLEHLLLDDPSQAYPIVVLCDFGFAKQLGRDSAPRTALGTSRYTAPEVMAAQRSGVTYNGGLADMYSCGVCLLKMLYGVGAVVRYLPRGEASPGANGSVFGQTPEQSQLEEIDFPEVREHTDGPLDDVSDDCKDFMRRLLQRDARLRMKTEMVWEHPWFEKDLPPSAKEYNNDLMNDEVALERHYASLQTERDLRHLISAARRSSPTSGATSTSGSFGSVGRRSHKSQHQHNSQQGLSVGR